MRLLGVVQWANRDKNGTPIAGVRPIVELQKTDWRPIDAAEEFRSEGQAFWWNAQSAIEGGLILFSVAPNPGQKDEFRVVDPKPVHEVLDLRSIGTERHVLAALVNGIRGPDYLSGSRVLVWCQPDVLIGPVDLVRVATGTLKLHSGNLARVPMFVGDVTQVRSVVLDTSTRLLRVDDSPPTAYVDWDDDTTVLRRALEAAVRISKRTGQEIGQTKKQIEDAARALAEQGVGPDAKLDLYRVEHALTLLENTVAITRSAGELAELLREHPVIKASLDELSAKVRAEVEQNARAELQQRLESERAALKQTSEDRARARAELDASEMELRNVAGKIADARSQVSTVAKEVEAAVDARVLAALDRPLDLLAEVSVLRPLLGSLASRTANSPSSTPSKLDWSRTRGEDIKDKVTLRRLLTSAARGRGVDPSLMLQVHAAVVAGLMPVTVGPGALAALTAYVHGACGGRVLLVHVPPSAIHPHDFDELPGGGLVDAIAAAKDIDGLSIVILEGANRSPLEASVVPLLQLMDLGLSPLSSARGLRLAASLVAGATTVPVTPQLWSHAAAIYPDPISSAAQIGAPGDIVLASQLLVPRDEPTSAIDGLLETWTDCRELRPTLSRLGSALAGLYDDETRLTDALLHALVLPYVATALTTEEQADAVGRAGDAEGVIAQALRRLRRSLA